MVQFFIIYVLVCVFYSNNIYYTLLYTFISFFLVGICLAIYQIDLFMAFLWLIECSVLFVFLLLLFYINVKGMLPQKKNNVYMYLYTLPAFTYIILSYSLHDIYTNISNDNITIYAVVDNYYEAIHNHIQNDLFGFTMSYYTINAVEFIIIGILLLIGSIVCVNLYQFARKVRVQNYSSYTGMFNFFENFSNFFFLRKQNIIKQGNVKASVKVFKKK